MRGRGALEVTKTVLEVADVAWTAVECHHHHHSNHPPDQNNGGTNCDPPKEELDALRAENLRLRKLLEQNLKLLDNLSESPPILNDCPPDLYARLVATVDSEYFLSKLNPSTNGISFEFPPGEDKDIHSADILINTGRDEPSWWLWISDDMLPSNVEEWSGIDSETYVVVTEEDVVDAVANFIAKCVMSTPRAQKLTPKELQKIMHKALGGVGKLEKMLDIWHAGMLFYTLSMWGFTLAGLWKSRTVLKLAAKGLHATSKVALRAL